MKKAFVGTFILYLGIFASTALAVEVTWLGPKQCIHAKGEPDVYTDRFHAHTGKAKILVVNGNDDGSNRISNAAITLNGERIFGPKDFSLHTSNLSTEISLENENTLNVELKSHPGKHRLRHLAPKKKSHKNKLKNIFDRLHRIFAGFRSKEEFPRFSTINGPFLTITITQDVPPPGVSLSVKPQTIVTGQSATLSWSAANAKSCVIAPDIGEVPVSGDFQVAPLHDTTYVITAYGAGGSSAANIALSVTKPAGAPTVQLTPSETAIALGQSVTLSWISSNADKAYIDNGVGTVPVSGSITIDAPEHTTFFTLSVTGPNGSASAAAVVHVAGNPFPQPQGTFGHMYNDLVPQDATIAAYDEKRFAIVTGIVHDINDAPIESVVVTILGHPEYGTVTTDSSGRFAIPVEGGASMAVVFQKQGLISAQRMVDVPWNDFAVTEAVQMISEDPVASVISFNGNPNSVTTHQSTLISDTDGSRSATLVFSGDNMAYLVDENSKVIHQLPSIRVRATEYNTPKSMPAALPPTSAFTYCVELSIEGAKRVRFAKPVVMWVDNFIGFNVGESVPVGYFDRDRGVWVPSDNGVVVELLDTDADGRVDALDADGDGLADDLDHDGTYSNEVIGLEDNSRYAPGDAFWRSEISHFTPWDCNWPWGLPFDIIEPNPDDDITVDEEKKNDCKDYNNSYVESRSRIYNEDISIPGTDLALHYASNRVEGYLVQLKIPVSGPDVPASLAGIFVRIIVAGKKYQQTLPAAPNQFAEIYWDRRDFRGNYVDWTTSVLVEIGFVYPLVYNTSRAEVDRSFAQIGFSASIEASEGRSDAVVWKKFYIFSRSILTRLLLPSPATENPTMAKTAPVRLILRSVPPARFMLTPKAVFIS